jgi:hypothetical protein
MAFNEDLTTGPGPGYDMGHEIEHSASCTGSRRRYGRCGLGLSKLNKISTNKPTAGNGRGFFHENPRPAGGNPGKT